MIIKKNTKIIGFDLIVINLVCQTLLAIEVKLNNKLLVIGFRTVCE